MMLREKHGQTSRGSLSLLCLMFSAAKAVFSPRSTGLWLLKLRIKLSCSPCCLLGPRACHNPKAAQEFGFAPGGCGSIISAPVLLPVPGCCLLALHSARCATST